MFFIKFKRKNLLVSTLTHKELEKYLFIIITRKKWNRLKINDFSWAHQRLPFTGKAVTPKLGKIDTHRESKKTELLLRLTDTE